MIYSQMTAIYFKTVQVHLIALKLQSENGTVANVI